MCIWTTGIYLFFIINALPIKAILSTAYDSFPAISSPTNINHRPTFKMHSVDFQLAVSCKSPLRGGFYEAFIAPYSLVQVKHC